MGKPLTTIGKYDGYEVISALQKEARLGNEEMLFYWVMELIDTRGECAERAFQRLSVILEEDIGIADMMVGIYARQRLDLAYSEYQKWIKKGNANAHRTWELPLTNVILAMCRSRKTRAADWFKTRMFGKRACGWHPPIPDYALDKHTRRGKKLRRGIKHFIEIGCRLVNELTSLHPRDWIKSAALSWQLSETGINIKEYPPEDKWTEEIANEQEEEKKDFKSRFRNSQNRPFE